MALVDINPDQLKQAWRYSNMLRTRAESTYASAYIDWLRNGAEGNAPARGRITIAQAEAIKSRIDAMELWKHVRK